ncbi:MAG: glycosyltransferase family 4 protein [Tepidisphaeraceae bacterium]
MSRRLLILVTDLEIGGTPTVVRELAVRLHGRGHSVAVACLGRRGPVADQIMQAGVQVTALGALGSWDVRILPGLLTFLGTGEFDAVFSFLIHANAVAAVACSLTGTRLFQSIQTTQPWPRWHWVLQRLIAPLASRVVVPSQSVADAARKWSDVPPSQIQVIPNAIDPDDFKIDPLPVSTPAHVGFIGRLDRVKRIPDLIEAAMLLTLALRKTHLHIFGNGPEYGRLQQTIDRFHAADFITLHGAIARPQDALKRISLLVLPSEAEGFGLVLVEAMAAGIPIVATDAPGIRDVVKHNQTGLLVPVGSPASLASAVRRLLDDEQLRRRLIAAGHDAVARHFSWSSILPVYEQLLFPEP